MEESPGKIVGRRVHERRRALGMTQEELSRRTGMRQGMISQIEAGKNRDVETKTLIAFAKGLGVSIDWLVGLKEEEDEPAEVGT